MGHKKSQLCRFFIRGFCKRGKFCLYTHERHIEERNVYNHQKAYRGSHVYDNNYNKQERMKNNYSNAQNIHQNRNHINSNPYEPYPNIPKHYWRKPNNNGLYFKKSSTQCCYYDKCRQFPRCGYAHFEVCRFQENCNKGENCNLIHLSFLGVGQQNNTHQ